MQNYGLVTRDFMLTELGNDLADEPDGDRQAERFAAHILKNLQGMELLAIVQDLRQRGVAISNSALRAELRRLHYKVTTNSGDAGKLRQWLAEAAIITTDWDVDEVRLAAVAGTSLATIGEWQTLTKVQRAFLETIRRLSETRGQRPIPSPELLDFVREEHGPIYDEGQVRKVYLALSDGDWIDHSVKQGGRGGKGGEIAATSKLIDVDFELLLGFRAGDLPADLRAVMTTPLETIYRDLDFDDRYVKGIALELLAVNLATDLGLQPVRLRIRGTQTGGAEVDLVAEAAHLHFSRWLFQCKNTASVGVDVLAKEVGMATLLQAQVIVIATTGTVSKTVVTYAQRLSETTPFQVVLVDRAVLASHRVGGAMALRERFHTDAATAMRVKRQQVLETLEDLGDAEN